MGYAGHGKFWAFIVRKQRLALRKKVEREGHMEIYGKLRLGVVIGTKTNDRCYRR